MGDTTAGRELQGDELRARCILLLLRAAVQYADELSPRSLDNLGAFAVCFADSLATRDRNELRGSSVSKVLALLPNVLPEQWRRE